MTKNNILDQMILKANAVRKNAYVPISNFPVGACIRTKDSHFYVGCNLENASFSMTICAESAAIAHMVASGERDIRDMVVIAEYVNECPPCGACRQRLYEFSTAETKVYLCSKTGEVKKIIEMARLLAEPFEAKHVSNLYKY